MGALKKVRPLPAAVGYSGKPLAAKLGFGAGASVHLIGEPSNYREMLGAGGEQIALGRLKGPLAFVHLFVTRRGELSKEMKELRKRILDTGVIWVSWPKKASGVETDVTDNVIREVALPMGFVDVKVCAVDEVWSGLKLVVRVSERGR